MAPNFKTTTLAHCRLSLFNYFNYCGKYEQVLTGRTIRKVMVGVGNFRAAGIFFRYHITCMNIF